MEFRIDIFNKYLEVKQDLVNNLKDIFNRSHYYTHKYRGNMYTDLNVALSYDESRNRIVQIFIRNNGKWIRDVMKFNPYTGYFESELRTNLYDN